MIKVSSASSKCYATTTTGIPQVGDWSLSGGDIRSRDYSQASDKDRCGLSSKLG